MGSATPSWRDNFPRKYRMNQIMAYPPGDQASPQARPPPASVMNNTSAASQRILSQV